jgi:ABC-type protease/lipase transport system fused ATPase/permease subunit
MVLKLKDKKPKGNILSKNIKHFIFYQKFIFNMKKILLFLSFCTVSIFAFAQNTETTSKNSVKEATAKLKETYRLNDAQTAKMETIQALKEQNLSEIEKYKNSNEVLYVRKREAISLGTNASIERMLDKEQIKTLRAQQGAVRLARAKKSEELKNSKASDLQKKIILLELED